jgi:hemerythrin-like domain-containing protein
MHNLTFALCISLHEDHLTTLQLLDRLEAALTPKSAQQPPETGDNAVRNLLTDVASILRSEVTSHFAFEEENLFPRFAEELDEFVPGMLMGEHEIIRPLANQLIDLARAGLEQGFDAETWTKFRETGLELVEREVFHIQKEEMGFLPGLEEFLDEEESARLNMAYLAAKG